MEQEERNAAAAREEAAAAAQERDGDATDAAALRDKVSELLTLKEQREVTKRSPPPRTTASLVASVDLD